MVPPTLNEAQKEFYDAYSSNVELATSDGTHLWVADIDPEISGIEKTSCSDHPASGLQKLNFVSNCGTDFAGDFLKHALPNIEDSTVTAIEDGDSNWAS